MEDVEDPVKDEKQPTVTEELLQIFEDFGDYIDKFMFEIVTFLAVIDSSMGLIKDVLGTFGFKGWQLTFFPSFSFVVTIGVFLFGTKKRKGKREADAAGLEGLGEAMNMLDDMLEVVDDVVDELEEGEGGSARGLGLGDYGSDSDEDSQNGETKGGAASPGGDAVLESPAAADNVQILGETQQETKTEAATPNQSSVRRAIRLIVLVVGLCEKLRKKGKKGEEEETPKEDQFREEQEYGDGDGTGKDSSTNSTDKIAANTGSNLSPCAKKSELGNGSQQGSRESDGISLGETGDELKLETVELVNAVKDDAYKAVSIVKEGSLEAGSLVQQNTGQLLETTGTLKAGRGLLREVNFIGGRLNQEASAVVDAAEKETYVQVGHLKENPLLKATGAVKIGSGLQREVGFISGKLSEEATSAIKVTEREIIPKYSSSTSAAPPISSASETGVPKRSNLSCEARSLKKETTPVTEAAKPSKKFNSVVKGTGKSGRQTCEYLYRPGQETYPGIGAAHEERFHEQELVSTTVVRLNRDIAEDSQQKASTAFGAEVAERKQCEMEPGARDYDPGEITRDLKAETSAIVEIVQKDVLEANKDLRRGADEITSELQAGTSEMASNTMEGAEGVAGSAASAATNLDKKAKRGIEETQRKSGGLIQIISRLVRLIRRVTNRKKPPQVQTEKDSPSKGAADSGPGPSKGKRSAEGAGEADFAQMAGSVAGAFQAGAKGGGPKGAVGIIRTVMGVVMRLVRLVRKSNADKNNQPEPETPASETSVDQVSDSDYFDCGTDFTTAEIHTQTEQIREISLVSMATQTEQGSTSWNDDAVDGFDTSINTQRARTEDLNLYRDARIGEDNGFVKQTTLGESDPGENAPSLTRGVVEFPREDITYSSSLDRRNIKEDSPCFPRTDITESATLIKLMNYTSETPKEMPNTRSIGPHQRITLKISGGANSTGSKSDAELNSIFIDIDAPVVLHSAKASSETRNDGIALREDSWQMETESETRSEKSPELVHCKGKSLQGSPHGEKTGSVYGRETSLPNDLQVGNQSHNYLSQGKELGSTLKGSHGNLNQLNADPHNLSLSRRQSLSEQWISCNSLVQYSSSSEDVDPLVKERRSMVVRFSDERHETGRGYVSRRSSVLHPQRGQKQGILGGEKTTSTRLRVQERSLQEGSFGVDGRIPTRMAKSRKEHTENPKRVERDVKRWTRQDKDDQLDKVVNSKLCAETANVRTRGRHDESSRLLGNRREDHSTASFSGVTISAPSTLRGSRSSYFGDDEADELLT